ncbi:hypothetical protein [Streptomyces erythrochromogenes]|uniref:hypothetical protein n=1 Tax=Streptomyces erythrochromogenes TaxID=285574 RepID=UPI00368CDE51
MTPTLTKYAASAAFRYGSSALFCATIAWYLGPSPRTFVPPRQRFIPLSAEMKRPVVGS